MWGRELYFDATKAEANAGIPSSIPRFNYDASAHVADLFADQADAVVGAASHGNADLPPRATPLPIAPEDAPA